MNWLVAVIGTGIVFNNLTAHPDKASASIDGEAKYLSLRADNKPGDVFLIPINSVYDLSASRLISMNNEDREKLGIEKCYMSLGWD